MDPSIQEYDRLRAAVTERLNAHDLLDVMDHGAPETEYDLEMGDFVRLMTDGVTITPEVVASVWHKWFGKGYGNSAGEVHAPDHKMEALAVDLHVIRCRFADS